MVLMPKVGNYVQRSYNSRNHTSTWSDYNKAWGSKRSSSIQKGQALRNQLSNAVTTISTTMVQQQAYNTLQNTYSRQATFANSTAVSARVNMLI